MLIWFYSTRQLQYMEWQFFNEWTNNEFQFFLSYFKCFNLCNKIKYSKREFLKISLTTLQATKSAIFEYHLPFCSKDTLCRPNFAATCNGTWCNSYVDVQRGNETALQVAVATVGTISVAIDGSHESFKYYKLVFSYNSSKFVVTYYISPNS